MIYKPNQRVAYYKVTGISDPSPSSGLKVGDVLVDSPRGKHTQWDFSNLKDGGNDKWITGKRIGFAIVSPETLKPVPESKLQAILDAMREAIITEREGTP